MSDFRVKWGIFKEKRHDFWVKWGIFEKKTGDFCGKWGIFKEKWIIFAKMKDFQRVNE